MTERRRVVVTGMGALTALGPDVASTWDGLVAGRSGVRTIESFDPARVDSKIAAEVPNFDPGDVVDRKDVDFARSPTHVTDAWSSSVPLTPGIAYRLFFHVYDRSGVNLVAYDRCDFRCD